ncbi:MAG TPA: hypothetical protein P5165_07680 [Spirochaetia bacterium]|nr:hypothetical protein [Spirochaetales bacterium]HRY73087.1 hypothetical protein [Spirochaetia bacterium]
MGILGKIGIGHAEFLAEDWLPREEREYAAYRAFDEARRRARLRRLASWAARIGRALGRIGGPGFPGGPDNDARPGFDEAPPETSRFVGTWDEERGYRRGLPPLSRRRKAEFVRRLLSCPPDTLPSPPFRRGSGGLYLVGGEASLLALELRRSLGF